MEYPVTQREDRIYKGFTVGYVIASFTDLGQTLYGLSNGFKEGNPIAKHIANNFFFLSSFKILGIIGIVFLLLWLWNKQDNHHKIVVVVPIVVFIMQMLAVIWNTLVLVLG